MIRKATRDDVLAFVGMTVDFWYKDYLRTVTVERIDDCKNKNVIVRGFDVNKGEHRSFGLKDIEVFVSDLPK